MIIPLFSEEAGFCRSLFLTYFFMKSVSEICITDEEQSWNAHEGVYQNYDGFVYSIMATAAKRDHILQNMKNSGETLIVGCGPTAYLEKAILETKSEINLVTSDFDFQMIERSKEVFTHSRLMHERVDMTDIPSKFTSQFDHVISTNSLVLPTREQTQIAYAQIAESLKDRGSFLAFLPSFEFVQQIYQEYPSLRNILDVLMDTDDARLSDTTGFQSFHTQDLISQEIGNAGLTIQSLQKISVESEKEFEQLVRVYSVLAGNLTREIMRNFWEFFVIAEKNPVIPEIRKNQYSLDVLTEENLNSEQITEISHFYRDIFDNLNAQHFLVDPETFEFKHPRDVFDKEQLDEYDCVSRYDRDSFPEKQFPFSRAGNQMIRWHDPEFTRKAFVEKYSTKPLVFVLRDEQKNTIEGVLSFFESSLEDVFQKSWKDPLQYSKHAGKKQSLEKQFQDFFECIPDDCAHIAPETQTICLDFIGLSPQAQQDKKIIPLLAAAVQEFLKREDNPCLIAESKVGAPSHRLFKKRCKFKPLSGFFTDGKKEEEGDDILEITNIENFCEGLQFLFQKQ